MNGEQPAFFEPIRQRASQRWDQLEQDPELAGPWHQLFKQVQSPRHILSELLQNADDAGATEASVSVEDQTFIFTHNGEDFTEEHFASLCRFGYSNKRSLHTIGFRGIGFKSTFSLGDTVELYSPTLSVAFYRQRFTEPRWVDSPRSKVGSTQIHVVIRDERRQREVEKNLQEWLKSPLSLLFFRHIRCLRIGNQEVHWGSLGPGPVPETEWMALHDDPDQAFLIARSEAEPFPADALTEIVQERLLSNDQDSDFPPCRVEIVLGAKGRLYVVLPTGVETALPFACNAPFIQDPARLKIKDLETSPTNQWLLERIGALAASVMLLWLQQTTASLVERSDAYGLFPDVNRNGNSLEEMCATAVGKTFTTGIKGKAILLTQASYLKQAGESVVMPEELFDVWPEEQATTLIDGAGRPAFSRHVSGSDREKLVRWGVIEKISKDHILNVLQTKHLPRPKAWRGLLKLWAYVAPEISDYRSRVANKRLVRIVPVQGKDVLYAASEIVRLGEKRLLQSDADWDFLAAHLLVLNQNWPRFLAEQRRDAEERKDKSLHADVDAAYAILNAVGLEETSDVSAMVEQVALDFFRQESIAVRGCIQLAQIASKLGANVGEAFRFVTRDRILRAAKHAVLFDADGTLEALFPETWCSAHLLHTDYPKSFDSCTREEWFRWISSGRSGLYSFAPLVPIKSNVWNRHQIDNELHKRGFTGTVYYPYVTSSFEVEDWDFEDTLWRHWITLTANDDNLWGRVVDRILAQPETYWSKAKSAKALQIATTGTRQAISQVPLLPAWILKLRDLPCLPDTRGFYHRPADLLRRTPETESLMDVEPFIHGRLDTEATRPLLKLLGVRDTPTGPDRLLDCLRALAKADRPPVHEVEKWYRRLDQMIETCSTTDFTNIKKALWEERIILTEGTGWAKASGVFLSSDEEDVPGAAVIRASVSDLSLWRKISVAERPTPDLAIQWLKELPSGKVLPQDDARRVRALLVRYPVRIWEECAHWLNLAGEWAPAGGLSYSLTMQSLIPWGHLHPWVKQKTADLQRLPGEVTGSPPFSNLPALARHVEERFQRSPMLPGCPEKKDWLTTLGTGLHRIELDTDEETHRVRALAEILAETDWHAAPGIQIIPYIDGAPAGTPRQADVLWLDRVIYVDLLPKAKLAKRVPEEIGKSFGRADIKASLDYSFERSPEDVREYLEQNFKLAPLETVEEEDRPLPGTIPKTQNDGPLKDTDKKIEKEDAPDFEEQETGIQEAGNDDQSVPDDLEETAARTRPTHRPAKPNIIELFAKSQGFQKENDERFLHADGSWIAKAHGDRFPWERRTADGEIVRYYWSKDHCLEREALQLESDIWGLIDQHPEIYALILSNAEGGAVEVTGAHLRAMRDAGDVTLYPATYRLVYNHDRQQV
jgi:hypothetical protein